ncbi:putative LRR containing protein [Trachipleistophora hominis]|uniref:Putative LRR containing protein n=1 Tax=Trachipleistophora hominis TaxID=72359 RepID=L7JVD4_TRAHO|nr:putative LRR containing protein [Trachipleistophora hominis]
MIINTITNILWHESLNHNLQCGLESLTLSGWGLEEKNIMMLRKFQNLRTLIVDSNHFKNEILENLPDQLETLEIIQKRNFYGANIKLVYFNSLALDKLKEHTNIRNLTFSGRFLRNTHIFACLPINLMVLKIMLSSRVDTLSPANILEKVTIKKLIIGLDEPNLSLRIYININPMKRQYYKTFDFLRNFIDFNSLDELVLETADGVVNIDKTTYRIK